jgi:hypothetical protein
MRVSFSVPRIRSACAVGLLLLSQQAAHSQAASQNQAVAEQEIAPKPPTLRQSTIPDAFTGFPFHASVQAADGNGDVVMTLRGALPSGLAMQSGAKTLAISGIPEAPGTFDLEITATDGVGNMTRGSYTMRVLPHPLSGPANAVIPDAETIHTTDTPHVFFPAVIKTNETIAAADADAVFMPVIINVKETITSTDADNHFSPATITDSETIHTTDTAVIKTQLGVTPTSVPSGTYGSAYTSTTFTAAGAQGTPTLTESGTLPTGMTISAPGTTLLLHGTPTQTGTFPFTITAKDTANTSVVSYSLVINQASQTIMFPQPASPVTYTYGLSTTLTATSSAGPSYPVTYSVSGPAMLSGSTLTYTGTGTVVVTANQAGDTNYAAANSVQVTVTVVPNYASVFVANSNGSVSTLNQTYSRGATGTSGGGTGLAVDSSGYVWSIIGSGNGVTKFTDADALVTTYTPTGVSSATALAFDGNSNLWTTNGSGTLTSVSTSGTPLSTSNNSTGTASSAIAIDISGNIWLTNPTANTVDEIIGGAVPVQPLATAVQSATPATKP